MAKLYFHYSTMNAGKSTLLLQASHNYRERGMNTHLLTAALDDRAGPARIGSRIGIGAEADTFTADDDLFARLDALGYRPAGLHLRRRGAVPDRDAGLATGPRGR